MSLYFFGLVNRGWLRVRALVSAAIKCADVIQHIFQDELHIVNVSRNAKTSRIINRCIHRVDLNPTMPRAGVELSHEMLKTIRMFNLIYPHSAPLSTILAQFSTNEVHP